MTLDKFLLVMWTALLTHDVQMHKNWLVITIDVVFLSYFLINGK